MIRCRTAFAIATAAVLAAAPAAHAQYTGPSSSQSPYIVPTAPGWGVASILTVGDSAGVLARSADGRHPGRARRDRRHLQSGDRHVRAEQLVHDGFHEPRARCDRRRGSRTRTNRRVRLRSGRSHLDSLLVVAGEDLDSRGLHVEQRQLFARARRERPGSAGFCSADLPPLGAFYNPLTGRGFAGRILHERRRDRRRGTRVSRTWSAAPRTASSFELPYLGRFSWENSVAHPYAGDSDDRHGAGRLDARPGVRLRRREAVERQPGRTGRAGWRPALRHQGYQRRPELRGRCSDRSRTPAPS